MMDKIRTKKITTVRDLEVYRKAFNNAMEIKDEGRWMMDEGRWMKREQAKSEP